MIRNPHLDESGHDVVEVGQNEFPVLPVGGAAVAAEGGVVRHLGHHLDGRLVHREVARLDDRVQHARHHLRREHRRHRGRAALGRPLDLGERNGWISYTPEIVYRLAICPRGNLPYIQNYPINNTVFNLI